MVNDHLAVSYTHLDVYKRQGMMASTRGGSPLAVSYTHLDVYKRQIASCVK
ncbi:hypothetical protein [Erwinia amylovora]